MTDTPHTPGRTWLKRAFVVSLAVNLFLIGLVGGNYFNKTEERPWPRGYSLHPRVMMQALPEDRHDIIKEFYAEARKNIGRSWRGIGDIRREIDVTLRAQPFDIEALREAQKREVDARAKLRMDQNNRIAALLAELTPEERVMIADVAMARMNEQRAYWQERRRQREAERKKSGE